MHHNFPFGVTLVAAIGLLGASGSIAIAQDPVIGGELIIASASNLGELDPQASTSGETRDIASNIFEGVITVGETGNIIPQLAESFEVAPDAMSYTFHIRDGVPFHNGDIMDVDDVIASWTRMKETGIDREIMGPVASFERVDDTTIVVHMSQPYPTFLENLSSPRVIVGILPAEIAVKSRDEFEPIGTGPFKFVEWVPDSHITLERFADYAPSPGFDGPDGFGGKRTAYVDSVTFRNVPEQGARLAGMLTGEYHVANQIAATDVPQLNASGVATAEKLLPWMMLHQTFNVSRAPGDNLDFRRAVQVGLDYGILLDFATGGNFELGHGWQYEGYPYYSDAGKEFYNLNDVDRAKDLLAKSGYAGEDLTILVTGDQQVPRDYSIALQDQLKKLGVNTTINAVDTATWTAMLGQKDKWDILIGGFGLAPSIGPFGMLRHFAGANNLQGYIDPELEDAAERTRTGLTFADRKQGFEDYQAGVLNNAYSIRVGATGLYLAVRNEVHDFKPYRVFRAWDVWVDPKS
ncbi:ABC transporter substrate-binding protein [Pseudoruegeria sp. SK021]|uniref:ABC transporter substrate-binding protein n=1 Tax=Pseudoruegeria sp. SK021 TaxID=1933035 RepID=UPI000A22DA41|nr:ABC transporter substrate-binding protein [Pseudoruegeria sp. SK021]OSP54009.1 hypothetical protein BV911_14860 [Pseudoruegeria sp. SK021]